MRVCVPMDIHVYSIPSGWMRFLGFMRESIVV